MHKMDTGCEGTASSIRKMKWKYERMGRVADRISPGVKVLSKIKPTSAAKMFRL